VDRKEEGEIKPRGEEKGGEEEERYRAGDVNP